MSGIPFTSHLEGKRRSGARVGVSLFCGREIRLSRNARVRCDERRRSLIFRCGRRATTAHRMSQTRAFTVCEKFMLLMRISRVRDLFQYSEVYLWSICTIFPGETTVGVNSVRHCLWTGNPCPFLPCFFRDTRSHFWLVLIEGGLGSEATTSRATVGVVQIN